VKGVLAQILKGNELNQRYLTPKDNVRKTWNNWMRLKRRKRLPEATAKFEGRSYFVSSSRNASVLVTGA
jgi:hypothetical protein